MEQRSNQLIFPLSRYVHYDHFRHYYPFGNSPAEDFLQSVAPSECRQSHPTVLSLGCGDMRSCMFTIYKHLGFRGNSTVNGPKGVYFVLNDRSASLLARNILFLCLCLRMPPLSNSGRPILLKWIASMWSIWYNHELQPEHTHVLISALKELDMWSSTQRKWLDCPLGAVVLFSSPCVFATVRKVWASWHAHYMEKSVTEMTRERNDFQCHHMTKANLIDKYTDRVNGLTQIAINESVMNSNQHSVHSSETIQKMMDEHIHYLTSGSVWAETVLGIPLSGNTTTVNPTFYERKDGLYSLHYALTPYLGYANSFHYTNAAVMETIGNKSPILQLLTVDDQHFKRLPLLANSVQQFAMWLIATSQGIQSSKKNISFLIDLGDAIDFCYHLSISSGEKLYFDVISTSNLFDHLSPPALVLTCLPLLKKSGTLFTATFKIPISEHRNYLETMFGFSPEFFPALLGVSCIGQDGRYSSLISPLPCPTMYQSLSHFVVFPWKSIKSQPLVLESIGECPCAVQFLLDLCKTSCIQGNECVGSPESFLCVLHQFMRVQPSSEYFIRALSAAIKNETSLKPYYIQLQTQSLLHGVHMHIILTEKDCPLCLQQPLENYIQQYSIMIGSCKMVVDEAPTFTLYLSSLSGDIIIISSFAAVIHNDSTLELIFHLPKYCCSQCLFFNLSAVQTQEKRDILSGTVDSFKKSSVKFLFLKDLSKTSVPCKTKQKSSLGEITKHNIGDCCTFETTISMSSMCLSALSETKMKTIFHQSNQLELYCGALNSIILYPYAIDESKTHINISKKRKTICIKAQRVDGVLMEDVRTFYIDRSNKLILPHFKCTPEKMENFCNMQVLFYSEENHPLNNAKSSFAALFTHALNEEKYFTLSFRSQMFFGILDIHALIYVQDLRFNPMCASPALDVSYCFLDTKPSNLQSKLKDLYEGLGSIRNIVVDGAEYKLLKQIFEYYSEISYCTFSTERHTVSLPIQKHKLWKYFDHAILFPLYRNPANPKFQKISRFMQAHIRSITNPFLKLSLQLGVGNVCAFCQIAESTTVLLKNCSICQCVKYCSEECKFLHKRLHEPSCRPIVAVANRDAKPENTTPLPKAHVKYSDIPLSSDVDKVKTHSSKTPSSKMQHDKDSSAADNNVDIHVCMRCKRPATIVCQCKFGSYCSNACQTLEWPEHSRIYHQYSSKKPANSSTQSHKLTKLPQDTARDNSKCSNCGKYKESLKQCSKCHNASYCSIECQRLDWPEHKTHCI